MSPWPKLLWYLQAGGLPMSRGVAATSLLWSDFKYGKVGGENMWKCGRDTASKFNKSDLCNVLQVIVIGLVHALQ